MKTKRVLTLVLSVLMLATCISFTVSADTLTVYVSDTAAAGGNGTSPDTAYDTFAEAWTAVAATGGNIVLTGNTAFAAPPAAVTGDVLITSTAGQKYDLYVPCAEGATVSSVAFTYSVAGTLTFENVKMYGYTNGTRIYLNAGGQTDVVIGEGVEFLEALTDGKWSVRIAMGGTNHFGAHKTTVSGGEHGNIWLTVGNYGTYGSYYGPMYLRYLGGYNNIHVGFPTAQSNSSYNRVPAISLLFDAQPQSVDFTNVNRCSSSTFQLIANNGTDVTKNFTPSKYYEEFTSMIHISSADGGRVDFIEDESTGMPVHGTYRVTTDRDYVVITNLANNTTQKLEVTDGELEITLTGGTAPNYRNSNIGKYSITYEYEPISLSFYAEEGDETAFATVNVTDRKVAFPETAPTKTGYIFSGWKLADGTSVTAGSAVNEATSYYAIWTPAQYTVTFVIGENGTTDDATTVTVGYGETVTAPEVIADEDWIFMGWTPEFTATVTGNVTYTAVYEQFAANSPANYPMDFSTTEAVLELSEENTAAGVEAAIEEYAETRRQQIRSTATSVQITGTSYYVSNDGNDSNDGLTPETAWKTTSKVSSANLKAGDGVFFRRGDTFRGQILATDGVTYSAYGEGAKPNIYGSRRNYSQDGDFWIKTEYKNVYVSREAFHKDVGLIVFNEGEAVTIHRNPGINLYFLNESYLANDLEMYHKIDGTKDNGTATGTSSSYDHKIYLYSVSNPNTRFTSTEICFDESIITSEIPGGGNNVTVDNLCIKYTGLSGVSFTYGVTGVTVQNCEVGWCGGSIQNTTSRVVRLGNGVDSYGSISNFTVENCYIYQIYDSGITHQYFGPETAADSTKARMKNIKYIDNLIEYCTWNIEVINTASPRTGWMNDIEISGNLLLHPGEGWGKQRSWKNPVSLMHRAGGINYSNNYYIFDNVIHSRANVNGTREGEYGSLIECGAEKFEYMPRMTGNLFIALQNGNFANYGILGNEKLIYTPEQVNNTVGFENNTFYYATKDAVKNYTITWVIDGKVETERYAYGATPTHASPTKAGNAQYTYTFTGWTPEIKAVTGNATYTAQFNASPNRYTVTWIIDGKVETETYAYGATPTHASPTKAGNAQYTYTFTGWTPEIAPVTGNATYTAQFMPIANTFTVTFTINGEIYTTSTVNYGGTVASPNYEIPEGYNFVTWQIPSAITSNITLNATLTQPGNTVVPDNSKPGDNKPDDSKPDDSKPDDSKSNDSKPDDSKPDDTEPYKVVMETVTAYKNQHNISYSGKVIAEKNDSYTLANGTEIPFSINYEGTNYLPARKLAEILGITIGYDEDTRTVLVDTKTVTETNPLDGIVKDSKNSGATKISVAKNSVIINVDGKNVVSQNETFTTQSGTEVPCSLIYEGTTYLPVRKLAELLGIFIDYDAATETVLIKK